MELIAAREPCPMPFLYAAYISGAALRSRIYTAAGPILRLCSIDLPKLQYFDNAASGEHPMLDTILLAAGVIGLLLTIAYAYACERM